MSAKLLINDGFSLNLYPHLELFMKKVKINIER